MSEKITWLASYPKSGNTWVRLLLTAYRNGGVVDIDKVDATDADNYEYFTRAVCPLDLSDVSYGTKLLLRPAALLHQLASSAKRPLILKTHHCNGTPVGLAPLIPPALTERAIYIVRDPRDVALSFSRHLGQDLDTVITNMSEPAYGLGKDNEVPHHISSWSLNIKTWMKEEDFPVLLVKYEDLCDNTEGQLKRILDFCDLEIDDDRIRAAVNACNIDKIRDQEIRHGFKESPPESDSLFFFKGGSQWLEHMSLEHIQRIQRDHSEAMRILGYSMYEKLEAVNG